MTDKKHFLTVYSYKKEIKFEEFTGHMDIVYTTFTIINGMPIKEYTGKINCSKCGKFKEYIKNEYSEYAKSHTIERIG